jgi:tyrosyl-tRNA synthetase
LGGSDQWGNITAGIDMIYRKRNAGSEGEETIKEEVLSSRAFGITIPLLVSSTGEKFGKSAGNAIWLDEKMTSYFDFYQVSPTLNHVIYCNSFSLSFAQFLMKTTDADVGKYLNMFTFLNEEQVNEVMDKHMVNPSLFFYGTIILT